MDAFAVGGTEMRDRLIELLDWDCGWVEARASEVADYLLANGVIVPPCKVGDTVWYETYKNNGSDCIGIQPHTVDKVDVRIICGAESIIPTEINLCEMGKTVFLTREEAEKALERRKRDAE
jgi:hypothetical protein